MDFNKIIDNREKTLVIDASGITLNNLGGDYLIPPGQISFFATIQPPIGWLECNGDLVMHQQYPDLFNSIGTTWGGNDISFNLPDFRNKFLRVWDNGKQIDENREFAKEQNNMVKNHTHTINPKHTHSIYFNHSDGSHQHIVYADTSTYWEYWVEQNGGPNRTHNHTWAGTPYQGRYAAVTMWRTSNHYSWWFKPQTYTSSEISHHRHTVNLNSSSASINISNFGSDNNIIKNKSMLCCIKY